MKWNAKHINVVRRSLFNDIDNQSIRLETTRKRKETHRSLVNASRQTFCISTFFSSFRRRGTRSSIAQPEINTNSCANTYGDYFYLFILLRWYRVCAAQFQCVRRWHRLRGVQHEWKTIIINKCDHLNFDSRSARPQINHVEWGQ